MDRKAPELQLKYLKFNKIHSEYRVTVEHFIAEIKCYHIKGSILPYPRNKMKQIFKIIAGLICRINALKYV